MSDFSSLLASLYSALSAPLTVWGYTFNLFSVWVFAALACFVVWFINNFRGD